MGEFHREENLLDRDCKTDNRLQETVDIVHMSDVRTQVDDVEVLHLKQLVGKVKYLDMVVRGLVFI